jgi:hypothetical protein
MGVTSADHAGDIAGHGFHDRRARGIAPGGGQFRRRTTGLVQRHRSRRCSAYRPHNQQTGDLITVIITADADKAMPVHVGSKR